MTLDVEWLNNLSEVEAGAKFASCCSSSQWVQAMVEARPYFSVNGVLSRAESLWVSMTEEDRIQTFIIEGRVTRLPLGSQRRWVSEGGELVEKNTDDDPEIMTKLATLRRRYEGEFGFGFIVSPWEKSPEDLLDILEARLKNSRSQEVRNATIEFNRIIRSRLENLR